MSLVVVIGKATDCFWVYYFLDEELTFVHPDDITLYNTWDNRAFELQVANHELLGHGSGKQFEECADGSKNFNPEKVYFYFCSSFAQSIDIVYRSSIL